MDKIDHHYNKMTKTNVCKLIVMLGIPTTISMLITNIYNLADTYFVGTLGTSPQAATGILFTLQCIIQAISFMLGHGSGTYVSKALAQKNKEEASNYVSSSFFIGALVGLLLMIFGLIFINPFMRLLGSTETILPYARSYGMWVLISAPFMITSLILNNNLRYEGKALYSMIGLSTGGLLNILGDFIFINICGLGIFGAGMSTAISQIISFIILLVLYITQAQSKISFKYISRKLYIYLNICKNGLPSLLRQGLTAISGGIINNLTKPFGDAAIAAMSIVNRYSSFVMCVGMGIGQGFQPVASFNYTAKEYDRVKRGLIFTMIFGTILVACLAVFGLIMPEDIMRLFQRKKDSQDVIEIGITAMRMASVGAIFLPVSISANMLYQSIRKSLIASILAMLRSGLVLLPVVFIFKLCGLGLVGIKLAQPTSDIISCLLSVPFIIYFIVKTPKTENIMSPDVSIEK